MTEAESEFRELASWTLQEAEGIRSTIPEFVSGLDHMITVLIEAKKLAEQAMKATGQ